MTLEPNNHPERDEAERPPWIEEAADPTYWDLAFGSYGDGYLEWVTSHYYWDADDMRSTADTRTLWDKRTQYAPELLFAEMNYTSAERDGARGSAA